MSPQDMADRIVANSERGITTTVNDIEHMESQSVNGMGVIKVFFRPGTNIQGAHCADDRDVSDHRARTAGGNDAAADHYLFRFDYSHYATGTEQQDASGAAAV